MKYSTMLIVSIVVISIMLCTLCVYLMIMFSYRRKLKKCFEKTEQLILNKYLNWCASFVLWTFIEYLLILFPLFTSVVVVYFSIDVANSFKSRMLLAILSILNALLPLINSKILPKKHADGFYKGVISLEGDMLRYENDLISKSELIDRLEFAEKFTNPCADIVDLELKLLEETIKDRILQ